MKNSLDGFNIRPDTMQEKNSDLKDRAKGSLQTEAEKEKAESNISLIRTSERKKRKNKVSEVL